MSQPRWPELANLNQRARQIASAALNNADRLRICRDADVATGTVIDFGVDQAGSIEAGIELARICTAGLAEVRLLPPSADFELPLVQTATNQPLEACMASQYAGWPLSVGSYFAMCSGPARALRGKEDLLKQYDLQTVGGPAVAVLEAAKLPDDLVVAEVAQQCGVTPADVTLCVARTASLAGSVQVVARSAEVAMHKLHELNFDLATITKATGTAPLPPIAGDDLTAMGWTNDAILYGGLVQLWVDTDDEAITSIGGKIPGSYSSDYGEPFLNIFHRYDKDFYKIDKLLFSPAKVVINNVRTGRVFSYGELRPDILAKSFGLSLGLD